MKAYTSTEFTSTEFTSTEFTISETPAIPLKRTTAVRPSPVSSEPFSLDQELTLFGRWTSEPILVPPRDCSRELADSMLQHSSPREPFEKRWKDLAQRLPKQFAQVREIDIAQDSIRLPKGRLYVTVTEKKDFDTITDVVPACVQTRLEEFLAGPGQRPGVRVYYLKPLCIEDENRLIFTTAAELQEAIAAIQAQVLQQCRRRMVPHYLMKYVRGLIDGCTAPPQKALKYFWERKKRAIDVYQMKMEFERRKTVMEALQIRKQCRTDDCSFEEFLSVTRAANRNEVVWRFALERQMNARQFKNLVFSSTEVALPWFITLSCSISAAASLAAQLGALLAPPVLVCDPVFVAELPEARGQLLKIGHFDEIDGVMHVEI